MSRRTQFIRDGKCSATIVLDLLRDGRSIASTWSADPEVKQLVRTINAEENGVDDVAHLLPESWHHQERHYVVTVRDLWLPAHVGTFVRIICCDPGPPRRVGHEWWSCTRHCATLSAAVALGSRQLEAVPLLHQRQLRLDHRKHEWLIIPDICEVDLIRDHTPVMLSVFSGHD